MMKIHCCPDDCLKCLSYKDIYNTNNKFKALSSTVEQRNYILDYLIDNTATSTSCKTGQQNCTTFQIKGKIVCQKAWITVHEVSPKRFQRIRNDYNNGSHIYTHGNSGLKRQATRTSECVAWLKFLINAIGDQQPDSGKVHLPSCFTKLAIYEKMSQELNSNGDIVSRSQFYSIMGKEFSNVLIPKVTVDRTDIIFIIPIF